MIVVTVGALAGFVQRRAALAAEFGYGYALRDLGLRSLLLMEITFFSSKTAIINSSYTSRIIMGPRIMIRMP